MYIIKNAWLSITRNKGRNILIAIIVMIIAAACTISLAILNSANKIVSSYEESTEYTASISMNRENLMNTFKGEGEEDKQSSEEMIETFNNISSLTEEEIINYGTSSYIKEYYYNYEISMNASDLEGLTDSLVKETTTTETTTNKQTPPDGFGESSTTTTKKSTTTEKIFNEKESSGEFTIKGYSSTSNMTEFIDGTYTITEGSVFTDFTSNSCLISEELATLNDLSVGDTITLVDPNNEDLTYELVISGIYKESSSTDNNMNSMFSNSANIIITTSTVINNITSSDSSINCTITPTYVLYDKDDFDAFSSEVEEKGLSEYYTVTSNIDSVEEATKSIDNVKTYAITFLILTLVIGSVVLLVINMINIRERKYEIGVLRTIGMKKSSVILKFTTELLIVSLVGLLIGFGIGAVTSVPVANHLLENEISNTTEQMQNIESNFGMQGGAPNDMDFGNTTANITSVDSINAVVDFKVLLELLSIGLLLTVVSSISSCVAIARFSPLTILKERS